MKATIQIGTEEWEFRPRRQCSGGCEFLDAARDPYFSSVLMAQLRRNHEKLAAVRRMVDRMSAGAHVSRMTDDELMQRVVAMLQSGEMHIHGGGKPKQEMGGAGATGGGGRPDPFAQRQFEKPEPRRAQPVRRPAGAAEPSFLGESADGKAIAAVLKAAAQAGTPFCEECQKAGNG